VLHFLQSWLRPDRFHTVLKQRSGRWYNACLRITGDPELAADAVQEALLKAWGRRAEFRGDADLDTWIHRIALNAAIDLMRRRKPQLQVQAHEDVVVNLAMARPAVSPESDYAHQSLGRDLANAMERLSASERQTFLLKHVEGWSLEDIADRHKTNVNNTKQTLFRAVRKLRVDLDAWRGQS
jgi:RNA polymerase sigma-70 factor (ECF subfamily)